MVFVNVIIFESTNKYQYVHMVERGNKMHLQAVTDVRLGEVKLMPNLLLQRHAET